MSFSQSLEQYRSKYNCLVQNVLLLSFYSDYKIIGDLRFDFTFSELYYSSNYVKWISFFYC